MRQGIEGSLVKLHENLATSLIAAAAAAVLLCSVYRLYAGGVRTDWVLALTGVVLAGVAWKVHLGNGQSSRNHIELLTKLHLATIESLTMAIDGGGSPSMLSVGASPLLHAVTGTNRYLARNHHRQAYFATLFFGVLDPASGVLIYVNGGHNPPVLVRGGSGEQILLPPTGPAVGILEDSRYVLGSTRLGPGDALFVYTDGVVDARNLDGRQFTMARLREVIEQPSESAQGLIDNVDDSLRAHVTAADQFDDITMLALRRDEL